WDDHGARALTPPSPAEHAVVARPDRRTRHNRMFGVGLLLGGRLLRRGLAGRRALLRRALGALLREQLDRLLGRDRLRRDVTRERAVRLAVGHVRAEPA